ncbi:hypothetical protein BJX76DRAFT_219405 [Aspergillus varians]
MFMCLGMGTQRLVRWRIWYQDNAEGRASILGSKGRGGVGEKEHQTEAPRKGFETILHVPYSVQSVRAEAIGADGNILASSGRVDVQASEVFGYLLEEEDGSWPPDTVKPRPMVIQNAACSDPGLGGCDEVPTT